MSHTRITRGTLATAAILVGLLAGGILGPTQGEAALPVDHGDIYIFPPTGVADGQEARLIFHNFSKEAVKVQFLLLDSNGQDLFVANEIAATLIVAPGSMATGVVPCNGILGSNQLRAEVTGAVILRPAPGATPPQQAPFNPQTFWGPASLQLVGRVTHQTLGGVIGPVDFRGAIGRVGIVGPMY